jgi:hypothetical protein
MIKILSFQTLLVINKYCLLLKFENNANLLAKSNKINFYI